MHDIMIQVSTDGPANDDDNYDDEKTFYDDDVYVADNFVSCGGDDANDVANDNDDDVDREDNDDEDTDNEAVNEDNVNGDDHI